MELQTLQYSGVVAARDGSCAQCGSRPGQYKVNGTHDRGVIWARCLCDASQRFRLPSGRIHRLGSLHDETDMK